MFVIRNGNYQSFNMTYDIRVLNAAYVELNDEWHGDIKFSPFSRIYMIKDGNGTIKENNREIILRKGNIYIIPPYFDCSYCNPNEELLKKIFFHVNVIKKDGNDLFSKADEVKEISKCDSIIDNIIANYNSKKINSFCMINSELINIIGQFAALYGLEDDNTKHSPITDKLILYINNNLSATLSVDEIAKAFYLSKSTLMSVFKKDIGKSIGKYIDDLLFIRANNLLCETDLTVNEISEILGFCDQFYFSKRFKAKYNVSPQLYRKNLIRS